jgi:hypothetical protein
MKRSSVGPLEIAVVTAVVLCLAPSGNGVAQTPAPFEILSMTYIDLDGDLDPFPDTGETGRVTVKVRNTGSTALTGATFILTSTDPQVGCITHRQVCVGSVGLGQELTVGSLDPQQPGFTFRASDTLNSTSASSPAKVHLCLQVGANEFVGLSDPACFDLSADLDLPSGAVQSFITGPDGTPDSGLLLETFDAERDQVAGITIDDLFRMTDAGTGLTEHAIYLHGYDMVSGSPVCSGFDPCILDPDYPMDWHLHCTPGSACANLASGACVGGCSYTTPANGRKAHSCSNPTSGPCNSLHMGAHFTGNSLTGDTTHLQTLQGFLSGPINLAVLPKPGDLVMSMYQIVDLMDDNGFGPNNPGQCADCADVQIQFDQDPDPAIDIWGAWEKLVPFQNVYDHTTNSPATFGSYYCEFTPTDTSSPGTMCHAGQNSVWSHCGSAHGTSASTTFQCPGPGEVDPSGTGVWVETRFDLNDFLGQRVRLRWVGSTWAFAPGTGVGSYYEIGSGWSGTLYDDGWWLDDISLTGVVTSQVTPTVDNALAPQTTCPAGLCDQVVCVACDSCHDPGVCDTNTGICSVGSLINCYDNDICTTDGCDADTGCVNSPIDCADGDACSHDTCDAFGVCQHAQTCAEASSGTSSPGGTVTSDSEADGATPADQIETSVTSPAAGQVTIQEDVFTQSLPNGYEVLNLQVVITAPPATATDPLMLVFRIDAEALPAGYVLASLSVFRDGVVIADCTGAPSAIPDPCLSSRVVLGDGDVELTVLTSVASTWNFALRNCDDGNPCTDDSGFFPACSHTVITAVCDDGNACTQADACLGGVCTGANYAWSGVLEPMNGDGSSIFKLGSTIPVKFALTGVCAGVPDLTARIFLAKITNSVLGSEQEASSTSAADTGNTFRYDATKDQYIYNLATKASAHGGTTALSEGTWQIRIAQYDGNAELVTLGTVSISLKK